MPRNACFWRGVDEHWSAQSSVLPTIRKPCFEGITCRHCDPANAHRSLASKTVGEISSQCGADYVRSAEWMHSIRFDLYKHRLAVAGELPIQNLPAHCFCGSECLGPFKLIHAAPDVRSEEHTSELQSRQYLV